MVFSENKMADKAAPADGPPPEEAPTTTDEVCNKTS